MRAVELKIHNFRSIHDATIRLEPLSLIAGANNTGKSNVVDAIRAFFGELKWDAERDAPKVVSGDAESWVEVEFLPTPDELAHLRDEYRSADGTFRVRNYLSPSTGTDGKQRSGYYGYERGVLSENLFYGAKNVGAGKVGHIVYIPAVSRIDDNTKLTGPSALRDLVAEVLNKVIAGSSAYDDLTAAFGAFEASIKTQTSEDGQSLALLEQEVTDEIAGWDASFSLAIQEIQPEEILKTAIKPQLVDETHGGEVDQARFGAGFQRHLIYTLIKLAAQHANPPKPPSQEKKEFSPQFTWILFEEPEAFLHPSQEEVLHDSLTKLVQDGTTQVLLTTHSSRFVSRSIDDLTRLIRLRRDEGVTSAYQLSQLELDKLFDDALVTDASIVPGAPADRSKRAVMAALKTELWLQPTRTAAFFCQRAILVEGASEVGLYNYMTTRGVMDVPSRGLTVVDCMGKYNIHRFMALMNAFGVDHSVLFDGDNGKSKDVEVTAAVTAATGSFTKRVRRLPADIETELGIPHPTGPNANSQKPQNLLYHLEAQLVKQPALEAIKQEFLALATN